MCEVLKHHIYFIFILLNESLFLNQFSRQTGKFTVFMLELFKSILSSEALRISVNTIAELIALIFPSRT